MTKASILGEEESIFIHNITQNGQSATISRAELQYRCTFDAKKPRQACICAKSHLIISIVKSLNRSSLEKKKLIRLRTDKGR
jgi:hypothetical protein